MKTTESAGNILGIGNQSRNSEAVWGIKSKECMGGVQGANGHRQHLKNGIANGLFALSYTICHLSDDVKLAGKATVFHKYICIMTRRQPSAN